jgi:hypothetical protein
MRVTNMINFQKRTSKVVPVQIGVNNPYGFNVGENKHLPQTELLS